MTMTKYLFSDNMSRKEDVITNLLSGLQGMTDGSYATLLDGTEADVEATGLALCSDPELIAAMDKNWSSAQYVGTLYYAGKTVLSETNSNLYDIDEGFKAALDHLDSRTVTDVWYNIIDGSTVRHSDINVIYDSEATTVIYTRVELETLQETKKEFVDLGLLSGTLWATCNVGASNPHDTGLFFAWGDTEGHGSDPSGRTTNGQRWLAKTPGSPNTAPTAAGARTASPTARMSLTRRMMLPTSTGAVSGVCRASSSWTS